VSFPVALLVTLAVEVPLYAAALAALRYATAARASLLGAAVNLLTHPLLWWWLGSRPPLGRFVVAEVLVWAVEAGLLWLALRGRFWTLAVVSAGANAASILAGLLAGLLVSAAA
jgi:hypothetical protein